MTNTFIYTLGNGWFPYNNIIDTQKSPSILKGCFATSSSKFIPLELFDGTLEREFYNFYNWRITIQPHQNRESGEFIYDIVVSMPEFGIKWEHFNYNQVTSSQLSNRRAIQNQFKFFNENKKFQLFIIDFQNPSYRQYSNDKLLAFEKYLTDNGFNLQNFVYLDTNQNYVAARYENTSIQLFKYDNTDKDGVLPGGNVFSLTRCFMVKDRAFIDAQVKRIESEYKDSMSDNG